MKGPQGSITIWIVERPFIKIYIRIYGIKSKLRHNNMAIHFFVVPCKPVLMKKIPERRQRASRFHNSRMRGNALFDISMG